MRADLLLVERGLAPSRTAAQRLIAAGHVFTLVGRKLTRVPLTKPGVTLDDDVALEVEASELEKFVSRGGLKLDGAITKVGLDVAGLHCLDVGQSTGGFTDCLLQRGAASVVGVDVGHSQLHPRLRDDPLVTCIEGVNARSMMPSDVVVRAAEAAMASAWRGKVFAASATPTETRVSRLLNRLRNLCQHRLPAPCSVLSEELHRGRPNARVAVDAVAPIARMPQQHPRLRAKRGSQMCRTGVDRYHNIQRIDERGHLRKFNRLSGPINEVRRTKRRRAVLQ